MKIKIVERGYDGFTGYFGPIEFADAVSVFDVSPLEAQRLSAILSVVDAATDKPIDISGNSFDMNDVPAVSHSLPTLAELEARSDIGNNEASEEKTAVVEEATQQTRYTQVELEAIADKSGIAGLREIADKLGVKGTSIAKLIGGILKVAGIVEPVTGPGIVAEFVEE